MQIIDFPHELNLIEEVILTCKNNLSGINHFIDITENSNLDIPMPLIEVSLQYKDMLEKILENNVKTEDM